METVLAAFVIIFVVLFAVLTLSNTFVSTQDMLHTTWEESDLHMQEQARTAFSVIDTLTHAGTQVELTVKNTGSIKLADFKQWDVIVQYQDSGTPSGSHIEWLPYTSVLAAGTWTVQGIYSDAAARVSEIYDRGILDPGEEALISLQLNPPIEAGSYVQVVVTPPNGAGTSTIFKRNVPPVLAANAVIHVNSGEAVTLTPDQLETTDVDDIPADLVYTVVTAPSNGALTPDTDFTQADIASSSLQYANTSGTTDSFEFTVSDGEDSIGSFTAQIQVNMPPILAINTSLSLLHGTAALIGDLMLKANDPDNNASQLTFTVMTPPAHGNLSMSAFTQADIDSARLSYTSTDSLIGSDTFTFTVSDGSKVIGPFTFTIVTIG